jgi:amino acid transporter
VTARPLLLDNDDDTTIATRNLSAAKQNKQQTVLQRHLSLFDLVSVGIGATVGSGVFVLTGFIAHTLSGPAVSCSWLLAGLAACLSGLCYAELGGRYPSVGSTYVYAKETMGTYASVVAAACLTLEYIGR